MLLLSARLSEESQLYINHKAEHYLTNQKHNLEYENHLNATMTKLHKLLRTAQIMVWKLNTSLKPVQIKTMVTIKKKTNKQTYKAGFRAKLRKRI